MSIHVALNHVTRYRYDRRVGLSPQVVRLRPAPHCRTPILSYSLRIEPAGHFVNWQQDPFANHLARLVFPDKTTEFEVTVDLVAEMAVYNPFDFFLEPAAESYPFRYEPELAHDLAPYLAKGPLTPKFQALLDGIPRDEKRTIDFLVALNQRLQQDIGYEIRMEPGVQTPELTLTRRSGSCRDTGWLLVQLLRHLGLAARFVSGYLIQLKPDVKSLDGPSGSEVDFTDLHAWCEVYLPGAGWIGLDPTSGLLAGEGHIPVACTPEPSTAAPVSGAVDECEVEFSHHMQITRIYESPRVTKPYTDDQWQAILGLGHEVDRRLEAGDVRLTMGGEPTFVSVGDRDGAEWNTDALGPTKRGYATELTHRLLAKYGAGGFLHFGQGKWYPGEQLPRWALSVCWRADGQACWHDPALFADERDVHRYTTEDAHAFLVALTRRLQLDPKYVQPGHEDTFYYLWRERRLPVNVDPFDARLDDELERMRLRRVFQQGLDATVGYVLPLKREWIAGERGPRWISGPWFLRDDRLYLIPGDSPMGYRLPLDALPWAAAGERPFLLEADPFAQRPPLPGAATYRRQIAGYDAHHAGRGFAEGGAVALQGQPQTFAPAADGTRSQRIQVDMQRLMKEIAQSAERTGHAAGLFDEQLEGLSNALRTDRDELVPQLDAAREGTQVMRDSVHTLQQQVQAAQREIERLRADLERTREESMLDPLTQVLNRRGFDQRMQLLQREPPPDGCVHGLLMIDIDHFKRVNDQHGHTVGDRVLAGLGT
ncbi:MAG: transglutaminase family protein, partial [Burkholderiales bacterium]|nr:transglutaminase family protein [Burkholderiales bacterium]